jgi:hypothetical protein
VTGLCAVLAVLAGHVVTAPAAAAVAAGPARQAASGPALWLQGLEKVVAVTAFSTESPKALTAYCPPGKVIVGGGGWARESGSQTHRLTLTRLEPSSRIPTPTGVREGYRVTAATTDPAPNGNWLVEAYALCTLPIAGRHIVVASTTGGPHPVQTTAAACPAGERVLGSGARINNPHGHQVGLQVTRASSPGDINRAQAQEDANGFPGPWNLLSFAVCAPEPSGYEVRTFISQERLSEHVKTATAECSGNRYLIGMGGAITNVAPGNVSLERIDPVGSNAVRVSAAENVPTNQDWDFIVATAICADAHLSTAAAGTNTG